MTEHREMFRSEMPSPSVRCSCGESVPAGEWDEHLRLAQKPAARAGLQRARAALAAAKNGGGEGATRG